MMNHDKTEAKTLLNGRVSLCGKLEALVGGYYLAGSGNPDGKIETLYYDPSAGLYEEIQETPEHIVAYLLKKETLAFIREDMLQKFTEDTSEYDITCIAVKNFDSRELSLDRLKPHDDLVEGILFIDDDFMDDENIEFDTKAFELIDSGAKYINPKHFSVKQLIAAIEG